MKLITKFKNRYNNITYSTYKTENGITVLHLDNPATIDFDFAITFKAGTSFEINARVPKGTAHYLEHMLLNPNDRFLTKEEIDKFEQGSKERPALDINAMTTRKNIYLTSYTNEKGYMRAMERLESIVHFSKEKISEQMEKERGIILAEKSRKAKKEKNTLLQRLNFLFKDILDEFSYDVLGEPDDIKSISVLNLEKYFKSRFITGNCVFAIQSKGELSEKVQNKLEAISRQIKEGKQDQHNVVELKNKLRIGTFKDDRANGVHISFIYFNKVESETDYKVYVKTYLTFKLLDWLAFDVLRQEEGLIYDFSVFRNSGFSYDYEMRGFKFGTEKEKTKETLKELHTLLYKKAFQFLNSERGREWFDNVISMYIFPRSIKFDSELAENDSTGFLENKDLFNDNIAVQEAKELRIEDIKDCLSELVNTPPHIWIEADMDDKEMKTLIKESPFEKQFNSKK